MDLTWNLDNIYTSLDSEELRGDIGQLADRMAKLCAIDLNKWENGSTSVSKLEGLLRLLNEYKGLFLKTSSYAYLQMNEDLQNYNAMHTLDEIEEINFEIGVVNARLGRWLTKVEDLMMMSDTSEYIAQHKFYLEQLQQRSKHLMSDAEELIMAELQNTGSKAWGRYYMELIAASHVELEHEGSVQSLSLSELGGLLHEKDSALREVAYSKEIELCEKISHPCCKCINGISGEALLINEKRGYATILDKVLAHSRMDRNILDAMITAIQDNLPVFHAYFKKKAELLGKNKLPFHDMFAPIGQNAEKVTYEDAQKLIISSFSAFHEKLGDFAKNAFDNKWIDAEPRSSKGNFGLSVDIFPIRESRIMTSFHGNHIDVIILAHEIGHAYHSSRLYNQTMLNTDYPAPIAETASIFCETLVNSEMIKQLSYDEKLTLLERGISDAAYYIVDFYGRYIFENMLYERRSLGELSVEELSELMLGCMKTVYGDYVDVASMNPFMWMNKAGYFMVGNEYLNFPYTFGILFAKGLYAEYIKKGDEFAAFYDKLLSESSTNSIDALGKMVDIDLHTIGFWREAFKIIEYDISLFI